MKKTKDIIIETYDYGIKRVSGYIDMSHFEHNVYMTQGYVYTNDDMIINYKNIKAAYYCEEEDLDNKSIYNIYL